MTWTPQPYSEARDVPKADLRKFREMDVSLEIGDVEHEFSLFYTIAGREPDVGIFSEWVDDWFYVNGDGTKLSEELWAKLDRIGARSGNGYVNGPDGINPLIDPEISKWHERNLERAAEVDDEPDYDY